MEAISTKKRTARGAKSNSGRQGNPEVAQAQNCASQDDVEEQARVIQRVLYCIDGSSVDGRLSTFCNY